MNREGIAPSQDGSPGQRSLTGWIALPVCLVLIVYLWFISAGLWVTWPKTSVFDYYDNLAIAFQRGQLYLDDAPSPELLALPDPYRIGARKNVEHIWDATLFDGRYYLYWGPVPALMLIPVKLLLGTRAVPDLYLAFAFVVGIFLVLSRLLWRVWTRFFRDRSPWTLSLGILVSGLAPPLTWMLNRPEVYEAALAGAQFFLLVALYLCLSVLAGDQHVPTQLVGLSVCLGLGIGCRTSAAFPALFILIVMTVFLMGRNRERFAASKVLRLLVALWVPAGALVLLLLSYNAARFGSAFEFGYRYQLTLLQMPKHYDELFSKAYVLPNLYNYLLNPFTTAIDFPPIRPQYGTIDLGPGFAIPRIYFSEAVTGLVFSFPFMAFAVGSLRAPQVSRQPPGAAPDRHVSGSFGWFRLLLLGVFVVELVQLLLFFFATERYLVEVVPTLAIAACIGFWTLMPGRMAARRWRSWIPIAAIVLSAITISGTTLLAVSSYQERVRQFNPSLIQHLNGLMQR